MQLGSGMRIAWVSLIVVDRSCVQTQEQSGRSSSGVSGAAGWRAGGGSDRVTFHTNSPYGLRFIFMPSPLPVNFSALLTLKIPCFC